MLRPFAPLALLARIAPLALVTVALRAGAAPARAPSPAADPDPPLDEAPAYDEAPAPAYDEEARAAPRAPAPPAVAQEPAAVRTGVLSLGAGRATVRVPPGFVYLAPDDAARLFADRGWSNPGTGVALGALVPNAASLEEARWGVAIGYSSEGRVRDTDDGLDADALLGRLRSSATGESDVVDWARPPRYDARAKRLSWAIERRAGDPPVATSRYEVRLLSRDGVLALSVAAATSELGDVERAMRDVVGVQLAEGYRYADFAPGRDPITDARPADLIARDTAAQGSSLAATLRLFAQGTKLVAGALAAAALLALALASLSAIALRRRGTLRR